MPFSTLRIILPLSNSLCYGGFVELDRSSAILFVERIWILNYILCYCESFRTFVVVPSPGYIPCRVDHRFSSQERIEHGRKPFGSSSSSSWKERKRRQRLVGDEYGSVRYLAEVGPWRWHSRSPADSRYSSRSQYQCGLVGNSGSAHFQGRSTR